MNKLLAIILLTFASSGFSLEVTNPPYPSVLGVDLNANGNDITNVGALEVDGNTTLGDAASDTVDVNASTMTVTATPDALNIATHTATAGDKIMSWDGTNRRVGIGNARPVATLSVHNTAEAALNCTANSLIVGQGDGTSNHILIGAQSIQAKQNCTTADVLKVNVGGGSVGIGTGSPGAILHTYGAGSVFNKIESSSGESGVILGRSAVQLWHLGANNAGISGNASHFTLTSTYGISPLLTATTQYTFGINISSPSARVHIHNGDIRLSTDTGTSGIYFPTGERQIDAGMHLIAQTTLAASATTYQFTGLDSLKDGGYFLDIDIVNSGGAAVVYSIYFDTQTVATDYYCDRSILDATLTVGAEINAAQIAVAGGSGQNVRGQININHLGSSIYYVAESRDGTATAKRRVTLSCDLSSPRPTTVTNFKVEADTSNGLGTGTVLKLYSKR